MPLFQILPTDAACSSAELATADAADILLIVQRLKCPEANVLRDGEYCFSVRLGANGMWCIYQNEAGIDDRVIPLAG